MEDTISNKNDHMTVDELAELFGGEKMMTKEQKDKILKTLAEDRNDYVKECNNRITRENGKIIGADYMLQRFFDILRTEDELHESEEK